MLNYYTSFCRRKSVEFREEERWIGMSDRKNMTTGVAWKEILLFSLPIMFGQFLQQLYNTVDGIVVGNFAGATPEACEAALAAVGGCMSLIMLFLAISIGFGNGGAVLVAQLYGAKRIHELRRAASTLLITLVSLGLFLAVVGSVFSPWLVVKLMRVTDPNIKDMAIQYFAIYSVGLIFQYAYNSIAGILRAIGDSQATMWFLIVSAVLNTVLDLLFVIKFGWGVVGVAVATVIAQAASAIVSLVYMIKKYPIFRFGKGEFVFDKGKFMISLRLGIPAIVQQAVVSVGNVFIQRLVNSFGQTTMSAFTVGNRMESYALVPIFGMNMGSATFTGQNVGAGKYDRVHQGWKVSTIMACIASAIISLILNLFAPEFAALFNLSGEAAAQAVEYQRYISYCIILFAAYMPTSGLLQGAGDALWSSAASLLTLTIRVLTAYGLAYLLDFGYASCWMTMPIGWAVGILFTYPRYFRGKWKNKAVVKPLEEGAMVEAGLLTGEDGAEDSDDQ